jgi:recombinational DNA repair ATPase RecF
MLYNLHVKNLALIDEQEIEFENGLNILTGETGAGKSVIIGSVNLALGAKADKDMIRTGCEYALIEMTFGLSARSGTGSKESGSSGGRGQYGTHPAENHAGPQCIKGWRRNRYYEAAEGSVQSSD